MNLKNNLFSCWIRFQEGADSESLEAEDEDAENNEEGGSHSEEAPVKSNRRFNKKKDIVSIPSSHLWGFNYEINCELLKLIEFL